ncbi:hypothetical protein [Prevotella merdae]|uniref:hypothetical protein n=1 Tax=Prevotella merdae TaxID=2079531 RepID=UPI003F8060BC
MRKYLIFAASALALASCSSDDFLGENPGNVQNATTAINFGGEAGKITRATSNEGTDVEKLDGQFKVYGVKNVNGFWQRVFVNYSVWDVADKNTTSNTNGWEYVGKKGTTGLGTGNITLNGPEDQTIKYWDYSASEYNFVAGSPIDAFAYNTPHDATSGTKITDATVSKLAGHIYANEAGPALEANPVYIADPVKAKKDNNDYKKTVTFNFQRQQSMVRVGFYETIPGYTITDIKFYEADGTSATSNNVILTSDTEGYFVGGTNVSGKVTYDWTTATPSYTFAYTDNTNLKKSKNWYAGKLGALENTSTAQVEYLYGTDKDMATATGYFTVLPTPALTNASAILIKCDYTLTADDHSGEVINVKGATAAIPAAFSKWEANTRYTYLFKISDNTNGTTGTPGSTDPSGLYPITFDAVVQEVEQGTTTTVATPSITTYQDGSVVGNTIEYKTGKAIYATVANETDGTLNELKTNSTEIGNVQVYKLSKERTEADLQIKAIAKDEIKDANKVTSTEVPATVFGNFEANKYLKFTPEAEGYYAIQYLTKAAIADPATPAAYTYKVVYVKAATTVVP